MALTTLAHHIDLEWLREAYRRTRKDGATGVDGQTAEEYATQPGGQPPVAARPREVRHVPGAARDARGAPRTWFDEVTLAPRERGILYRDGQPRAFFRSGTRLLRLAPLRARKRKRSKPEDRVVLSEERELRRVDGIWYEIAVSFIPPGEACFDVIERAVPEATGSGTVRSPLWPSGRYARSKRQLNSRELVRYRLANR